MTIKRKISLKKIIVAILFFTFLIISIISLINIIKWKLDCNNIQNQTTKIKKITEIKKVEDTENTELIKPEEKEKNDPYWDYIKMNLIDVDFQKLKNTNSNTKGWIQVNGTNINYPFVQAKDNKYYLNHSFDNTYNSAGWVFLDYRNNLNAEEKNTIIYAHGRLDKTMFGSLKNILTNDWLTNKDNYVVKISTEFENTLWQVFSVYHIETTSDYIKINFTDDEKFLEFANKLINRSNYNFNTTISKKDRILTLSTCYSNKEKLVLHAKLIKREKK